MKYGRGQIGIYALLEMVMLAKWASFGRLLTIASYTKA
jgi:hypothetical protein